MSKKKNRKLISKNISPENYIKNRGRNLPIYECLINKEWREDGLAQIIIVRQHSNGNLTFGIYLADVYCRGVKDTAYKFNIPVREYLDIIEEFTEKANLIKTDYSLVHNIIYGSIEYAEDFGFLPHRDFKKVTRYLLEEDDDTIDLLDIEFGFNGKPYLIVVNENEPYKKYLAILDKTAGPGNYNFILPSGEVSEEIAELEGFDEVFSNPPFVFLEPKKFDDETESIIEKELSEYDNFDDEQLKKFEEGEIEFLTESNIRMSEMVFATMFSEEEVQEAYDHGVELFEGIEMNDEAEIDDDELFPDESDMELLFQAYEQIDNDNPKKALKITNRLLTKYPDKPSLLSLLYLCYSALNKVRKSEDIILYAYQKFPKNISIRSYYFSYLISKEKFDEVEKIIAATGLALKDVNPNKSSYAPTIVIGYYQTIFFYYIVTKQLLKAKSILYQLKINGTNQTVYDSFYNLYLQSVDIFLEEIETELQDGDE